MAKTPTKKNTSKPAVTSVTGGKTKKNLKVELPTAEVGEVDASVLDRLFDVVLSRRGADPSTSHSARLLSRGTGKIAQKFGEEAVECLIEAVAGRKHELVGESADVLYHLMVLWVDAGVTPDEVWSELQRREGVSGIDEKASRPRA
ncbi:phosphoribosyl-ATP diphosphatase [Acetobacter conturbans]|uniref:Phosphoribosyl-ATP pyrophosphatase n=1 Tax=Acetobacter conturbans TaxID=1737472 RepID=A0ABX0K116_9PROT|nr:phosphoribosyl-ATP diphosphatase [Acetobacter conturbans]